MANYHLWNAATQQGVGPYTIAQLAQAGLAADALVWSDGMAGWTPAASVPELAPLLRGRSAMPPVAATPAQPTPTARPKPVFAWSTSGVLLICLIGFFLPFVTLSCNDSSKGRVVLAEYTAMNFALGTEPKIMVPELKSLAERAAAEKAESGSTASTDAKSEKATISERDNRGTVAFAAVIIAMVLPLIPGKLMPAGSMLATTVAFLCTLLLRVAIENTTARQSNSSGVQFSADSQIGFYLILATQAVAFVLGMIALAKAMSKPRRVYRPQAGQYGG